MSSSLIVPDHCKAEYTWNDAVKRWFHNFKNNPSRKTFFQPVVYPYTFKCYELSHDERLQKSKDFVEKRTRSFWTWKTVMGEFKICYLHIKPWNFAINPNPPHMILLHGFTSSKYCWRYLAQPLADLGFQVWVIDFLGSGDSDAPEHISYDPKLYAKQIIEFIHGNKIDKAHFVGHSLGGGISNLICLKHPELVQSLILICPLLFPLPLSSWYKAVFGAGRMVRVLGQLWGKEIMEFMSEKSFTSVFWTQYDVEQYVKPNMRSGGWHMIFSMIENYSEDVLKQVAKLYPKIKVPVLIVFGAEDTTIPAQQGLEFKKVCPQTHVEIIQDAGHLVGDQRPKSVMKAIEAWKKNLGL